MGRSRFDANNIPTIAGVSNSDGSTPVEAWLDPITHEWLVKFSSSSSVSLAGATSATVTSVGDTTTSTQLKAANSSRKEIEIYNTSSAALYLLKGTGTASNSNYTAKLNQDDYYSSTATTAFQGVWSSDAGGVALVTEST